MKNGVALYFLPNNSHQMHCGIVRAPQLRGCIAIISQDGAGGKEARYLRVVAGLVKAKVSCFAPLLDMS